MSQRVINLAGNAIKCFILSYLLVHNSNLWLLGDFLCAVQRIDDARYLLPER